MFCILLEIFVNRWHVGSMLMALTSQWYIGDETSVIHVESKMIFLRQLTTSVILPQIILLISVMRNCSSSTELYYISLVASMFNLNNNLFSLCCNAFTSKCCSVK